MKACILNSICDIKDCLKNNRHKDSLLFTTHPSVEVYLKEMYGLKCQMLSIFVKPEEVSTWTKEVYLKVDQLLEKYDEVIGQDINKMFRFNQNYFKPLYSYFGKHQYIGYKCFIEAVFRLTREYNINHIIFYNCRLDHYYSVGTDLNDLVMNMFSSVLKVEVVKAKVFDRNPLINKISKMNRLFRNPRRYLKGFISFVKIKLEKKNLKNNKPAVLIFHPLYNLSFLRNKLKADYNVIEYNASEKMECLIKSYAGSSKEINIAPYKELEVSDNALDKLFLKEILFDFNKNIKRYLKALKDLRTIHLKTPIKVGIWGNPPIKSFKSLAFEYLMKEKVRVIGAQHGSVYGDQEYIWHVDSDFNRCDEYFSYGFTQNDLSRLYGEFLIPVKVHPLGMTNFSIKSRVRKKIDILFPATNSVSMLNSGMARTFPHQLNVRQLKILEYLNELNLKNIYVKPFVNGDQSSLAMLSVFKRLKNLKMVRKHNLTEFLNLYDPGVIVLEFPTTTLYEALFTNAEIFILNDAMAPYDEEALIHLKKRVNYFECVDEMLLALDKFLRMEIVKKKDDRYFYQYVYKGDPKEKISGVVADIIKQEVITISTSKNTVSIP